MRKSIHSPKYQKFLQLLKNCREDAGVTQSELAARLGTTQSVVSKMESGERRVDLIEVLDICAALGVAQSEFILGVIDVVGESVVK